MDPNDTPAGAEPAPVDAAADAMAALDAGIAAADGGEPAPSQEAAPAAELTPEVPAADAPPADQPAGETPPAAAADAPPADGATPPAAEEPAAPLPDADTEAEITALGLKEKSAERFRTLAADVKELAPIRDALKAAGIDDVARLPDLVKRAEAGDYLFEEINKTGTTADQYGMAIDYLGLIGKAQRGDLSAAEQAWQYMAQETAALAKMLGKEVPGVHDPLAGHADLRAEVEAGDLPRARALEIASTRARGDYSSAAQRQQQEEARAAEQAKQAGITWLQQFDADARAQDPDYLAKRPALNEAVAQIRETLDPSKWPEATALAYARIRAPAPVAVAPAAPAAPAMPRPGPLRPAGPRPAMAPAFDNPLDALDFGIEQANNAAA